MGVSRLSALPMLGRAPTTMSELGLAADGVERSGPSQLLGDGDRVGGLARAVERGDGLEDVGVRRLVEVVDADRFYRGCDRVLRQQHRAEQRLLGLQVVRRYPG